MLNCVCKCQFGCKIQSWFQTYITWQPHGKIEISKHHDEKMIWHGNIHMLDDIVNKIQIWRWNDMACNSFMHMICQIKSKYDNGMIWGTPFILC